MRVVVVVVVVVAVAVVVVAVVVAVIAFTGGKIIDQRNTILDGVSTGQENRSKAILLFPLKSLESIIQRFLKNVAQNWDCSSAVLNERCRGVVLWFTGIGLLGPNFVTTGKYRILKWIFSGGR